MLHKSTDKSFVYYICLCNALVAMTLTSEPYSPVLNFKPTINISHTIIRLHTTPIYVCMYTVILLCTKFLKNVIVIYCKTPQMMNDILTKTNI